MQAILEHVDTGYIVTIYHRNPDWAERGAYSNDNFRGALYTFARAVGFEIHAGDEQSITIEGV